MGRFRYTVEEQKINNVLECQQEALSKIRFPSSEITNAAISSSETLLQRYGYVPIKTSATKDICPDIKEIQLRSWQELCDEAERQVGANCDLEDLFTKEELLQNEKAIAVLNEEYNQLHRLDQNDIAISALAGITSAVVSILLVGIPQRTKVGTKAAPLSDFVRTYFEKRYPEEEMQKLANSKISKVPYDAQDNRNTTIYVDGLSAYYHRLLQLGHDPLLGFVFGVLDILTGSMTTIDKTGKIVSQVIEQYEGRQERNIFAALTKQLIHLKSDITTSMGLPAPLMSCFNLLQFGSIGEENQTIAQIVQGMYYEGYDFIHFVSQSIPVMIIEVIVRMGYAIKRLQEGYPLEESIPVSLNRDKHPKLSAMLFIGHAASTGINAGTVLFTKNPLSINYPQWIAFAKYSYSQLKWGLVTKPILREKYVSGCIGKELDAVLEDIQSSFKLFFPDSIVQFTES